MLNTAADFGNPAIDFLIRFRSKLIKNSEVTSASVHDSQALAQLCDKNEPVYDDSAYVG